MTDVDELPVGVLGEIIAGIDAGRFVEVVDDAENTGGFLIVTYADSDRSPEVFDSWVESIVEVESPSTTGGCWRSRRRVWTSRSCRRRLRR